MSVANLDLEKACDRVDYDFVFEVLRKMGFLKKLIGWIRLSYRKAENQVLINGHPSRSFCYPNKDKTRLPIVTNIVHM